MKTYRMWILGFVVLTVGLLAAWETPRPQLDPRLVGEWIKIEETEASKMDDSDSGTITHMGGLGYAFSNDGTWQEHTGMIGCTFSWTPEPQFRWFTRENILIARTTYPIWSNEGQISDRVGYACGRLWDAARGKRSLADFVDQQFLLETSPAGTITLKCVDPDSPQRFVKLSSLTP